VYPGIGWLVFREKALVKETLGRQQVDRLADDITEACATLQEKGRASPARVRWGARHGA
jgi:hypothetical protein